MSFASVDDPDGEGLPGGRVALAFINPPVGTRLLTMDPDELQYLRAAVQIAQSELATRPKTVALERARSALSKLGQIISPAQEGA